MFKRQESVPLFCVSTVSSSCYNVNKRRMCVRHIYSFYFILFFCIRKNNNDTFSVFIARGFITLDSDRL